MTPKIPLTFDEELQRLSAEVARLQTALRAAFNASLPVESGARACGRALGVSRSLGWVCWNLAFSPEAPAALRSLPGSRGWELLLAGLARLDCPSSLLASLRGAIAAVERELHSTRMQPTMLRFLAAGGLDSRTQSLQMRAARKQARQAAEVLFGVKADAFLGGLLAGPPNRKGMVDVAGVSLFEGLARSRPGPAWPIFEGMLLSGRGPRLPRPLAPGSIPGVLDAFCSPGAVGSTLRASGSKDYLVAFVAPPAATGKRGVRAAFGQVQPLAGSVIPPRGRRKPAPPCHLGTISSAPTRRTVFDMLLHRDVPLLGEPVGALYGPPDPWPLGGTGHGEPDRLEAKRMTLDAEVERPRSLKLPASLASLSDPWLAMIGLAADGLGLPLDDFRHFRLVLDDPPMHGRLLMRWTTR
jgi:hypothetical protein